MKSLTPYWYTPSHQVEGKEEVSFQLRPIDQRTFYEMSIDLRERGVGPDGAFAAFDYAVIDWKGLPKPFSTQARRELLRGAPDEDVTYWILQIAGECYKRATLGEPEAKNS